ncbi:MAG: G8 domain-containing protein, partial [Pseudomonadota bacterium]
MADILWSDLRMENGLAPGPDDVVVVHSGDNVIFDGAAGSQTVKGLVIYGTFEVEDADVPLELTTDWAVVAGDGTFQVGTPDTPYVGEFTLTLAGKDNTNDVDLADYPNGQMVMNMEIRDNNAFLMAMGDGATISIHTDDAAKE